MRTYLKTYYFTLTMNILYHACFNVFLTPSFLDPKK